MNDLPAFLDALRAIAGNLDVHAGTEAPTSAIAAVCHALCCSLRSAADELEQAVVAQSAERHERASAN